MPSLWTRSFSRSKQVRLLLEELESREVPAILTVGAGKMFATLGAAAAAAQSGDTVRIDPGTFSGANAYAVWNASNLTIEGAGASRTVLDATGFSLPNRKGLFTIAGSSVTVRNIEFAGVHDTAGADNWAGIRQEGNNLTVTNCYFHNNDDGILGGGNASSNVVVEFSEFARNGYGDGFSHNIYIGDINSFTLRYCAMHDASVGHDVKSRAVTNSILYNWIGATGSGTESYEINLPDGGTAYIIGNVIRQDASTGNSVIVDWGSENNGGANSSQGFFFINNTVINDRGSGGTYVRLGGSVYPADVRLVNNIFAGSGTSAATYSGPTALQTNNLNVANPGFVNTATLDYHLTSAATAAINQGIDPGTGNGVALTPVFQYVAVAKNQARTVSGSAIDVGAFEFQSAPTNQAPTVATAASASPNPVAGTTTGLSVLGADDGGEAGLTYTWATTGTPPATVAFSANGTNAAKNVTATFTRAGSYSFQVTIRDSAGLTATGSVTVTVNQTLSSIAVTPASVTLANGATQQFTASPRDQFGVAMSATITWSLASGIGSVSATGLYAAPATGSGAATVRAASGAINGTATANVSNSPPNTGDFDKDGNQDIVWRQSSTGDVWIWRLNRTSVQTTNPYIKITTSPPGTDWQIVGKGDFDRDGNVDLLWRQTSSGQVWIWRMNGTALQASNPYMFIVNSPAGSDWQVVGVGDFDRDGFQDIVWRQTTSGQVWIWRLNGTALQASNPYAFIVNSPAGSDWQVVGVGDFDQDSNQDILWRQTSSGQVWIWRLNGTTLQASNPFVQITTSPAGSDWQIADVGDYDRDGNLDLLWRQASSGQVWIWRLNRTALQSINPFVQITNSPPGIDWQIV